MSNQPPPWAASIIEDLKTIKISVSKIGSIEQTVNSIKVKMEDLEIKVTDVDKRVTEVERSSAFIGAKYESQSSEIKCAKVVTKALEKSYSDLKNMVTTLGQEKQVMKGKIEDQEFRSMSDNLIFYGLPEAAGIAMGPENWEEKVKAFISDQLKEEAQNIVFDRVHRLGAASKSKQPRPIVAKCQYYHDREKIALLPTPIGKILNKPNTESEFSFLRNGARLVSHWTQLCNAKRPAAKT